MADATEDITHTQEVGLPQCVCCHALLDPGACGLLMTLLCSPGVSIIWFSARLTHSTATD